MPKINIYEQEPQNLSISQVLENVVYIPGLAGTGKTLDADYKGKPTLCKTLSEFTARFGETPLTEGTTYDKSFLMAQRLLNAGLYVLYEVPMKRTFTEGFTIAKDIIYYTKALDVYTAVTEPQGADKVYLEAGKVYYTRSGEDPNFVYAEAFEIVSGTKYYTLTNTVYSLASQYQYKPAADTLYYTEDEYGKTDATVSTLAELKFALGSASMWEKLKDIGLYDIRFVTAGPYSEDANKTAMIAVAEARGDAIALVDDKESLIEVTKLAKVTAIKTYFQTYINAHAQFYTPWCNFTDTTYGGTTNLITLPGSYAYLRAFAESVKSSPTWFAVAGVRRGQVEGLVTPLIEYGQAEIDILQPKTATEANVFAVNMICNIRPYGYRVWGNRTGKAIDSVKGLTGLNFANVRQIVIEINKTLFQAARILTFEQNSDILWNNFKNLLTPVLDRMSTGNGLNGYKIVKESTTQKATSKAKILILPIEANEYFELTVELSDSLVTVTE